MVGGSWVDNSKTEQWRILLGALPEAVHLLGNILRDGSLQEEVLAAARTLHAEGIEDGLLVRLALEAVLVAVDVLLLRAVRVEDAHAAQPPLHKRVALNEAVADGRVANVFPHGGASVAAFDLLLVELQPVGLVHDALEGNQLLFAGELLLGAHAGAVLGETLLVFIFDLHALGINVEEGVFPVVNDTTFGGSRAVLSVRVTVVTNPRGLLFGGVLLLALGNGDGSALGQLVDKLIRNL